MSDWAEFQGGPKHIGANVSSEVLNDPVEVKWKSSTLDAVTTAIVVHDGNIYAGSNDGHVYCFNAEDGSEQWKYETEGQATGGVAVRRGNVYTGDDTGRVYALTTDGALRWSFNSPGSALYDPITTTSQYVGFTTNPEGAGIKSYLHILDHQGNEVLTTRGDDLGTRLSQTFQTVPPTIDEDTVYQPGAGGLLRIDINDGQQEWEGTYMTTAASLVNNSIVGASFGSISSSSSTDGSQNWSNSIPNDEIYYAEGSSPIIANRTVVTAVGSRDNDKAYIYGHDLVTGDRQWETKIDADLYSAPVADAEYAYVGDFDGTVHALSLESGTVAWTLETGNPITSQFALADGVLYIGSTDGYVYAIHNAPPNDPPTPEFSIEPTSPAVGETVIFDASASKDDDGIDRYEWDTNENGVADATGERFATEFQTSGTYEIKLTVTDSDGVSSSSTKSLRVNQVMSPRTTTEVPSNTAPPPQRTATPTRTADSSPTKDIFGDDRGFLISGDNILSGKLSAMVLSAVGFVISLLGIVYTAMKET